MKTIFLAISVCLYSTSKAHFLPSPVDTIDFWHVFYNNKLVKQYNGYHFGNPLVIKTDSIKPQDSITVKYFRDTPCADCDSYLIIEYPFLNKTFIAHGTYTFYPLTLSLANLKNVEKAKSIRQLFEVYYVEASNNYKIKLFDIKLE